MRPGRSRARRNKKPIAADPDCAVCFEPIRGVAPVTIRGGDQVHPTCARGGDDQ